MMSERERPKPKAHRSRRGLPRPPVSGLWTVCEVSCRWVTPRADWRTSSGRASHASRGRRCSGAVFRAKSAIDVKRPCNSHVLLAPWSTRARPKAATTNTSAWSAATLCGWASRDTSTSFVLWVDRLSGITRTFVVCAGRHHVPETAHEGQARGQAGGLPCTTPRSARSTPGRATMCRAASTSG